MFKKIIISGGPHTGKTTLLEALKKVCPNAGFISEPASKVIERELRENKKNISHKPALPWTDRRLFNEKVIEEYIAQEKNLKDTVEVYFLDRSLFDSLAYCRYLGYDDLAEYVQAQIKLARYDVVLFCMPVGSYSKSEARSEDEKEAFAIHKALLETYRASGLPLTELPNIPLEGRVKIVTDLVPGFTALS